MRKHCSYSRSRWQTVTSLCHGNKIKKFTDLPGKNFMYFVVARIKIIRATGDLRSIKRQNLLLFPVDRDTREFFCRLRVTFLMPQVCFKPITWYFEMHHVRTYFSVWRHDFFVLSDVHSPHVYLQVESLSGVLRLKKNTPNLS